MNKTNLLLQGILSVLILISFASANLAIGFPSNIALEPGKFIDDTVTVQNFGSQDTTVKARVTKAQSADVSFPSGDTFQIKAGETRRIPIRIALHNEVDKISNKVDILFSPTEDASSSETVGLRLSTGMSFNIDVLRGNSLSTTTILLFVALSIIVVLLIIFLSKTARRK